MDGSLVLSIVLALISGFCGYFLGNNGFAKPNTTPQPQAAETQTTADEEQTESTVATETPPESPPPEEDVATDEKTETDELLTRITELEHTLEQVKMENEQLREHCLDIGDPFELRKYEAEQARKEADAKRNEDEDQITIPSSQRRRMEFQAAAHVWRREMTEVKSLYRLESRLSPIKTREDGRFYAMMMDYVRRAVVRFIDKEILTNMIVTQSIMMGYRGLIMTPSPVLGNIFRIIQRVQDIIPIAGVCRKFRNVCYSQAYRVTGTTPYILRAENLNMKEYYDVRHYEEENIIKLFKRRDPPNHYMRKFRGMPWDGFKTLPRSLGILKPLLSHVIVKDDEYMHSEAFIELCLATPRLQLVYNPRFYYVNKSTFRDFKMAELPPAWPNTKELTMPICLLNDYDASAFPMLERLEVQLQCRSDETYYGWRAGKSSACNCEELNYDVDVGLVPLIDAVDIRGVFCEFAQRKVAEWMSQLRHLELRHMNRHEFLRIAIPVPFPPVESMNILLETALIRGRNYIFPPMLKRIQVDVLQPYNKHNPGPYLGQMPAIFEFLRQFEALEEAVIQVVPHKVSPQWMKKRFDTYVEEHPLDPAHATAVDRRVEIVLKVESIQRGNKYTDMYLTGRSAGKVEEMKDVWTRIGEFHGFDPEGFKFELKERLLKAKKNKNPWEANLFD